ncbi:hypothetical protein, partial [Arthrobacter nitrophenolicus]|uniref:hypothetical protein n=1 Tax=Arthrobacter nitrophenolicus TaxID=683150 RepID=UPI0033947FF2
QIEKIITDMDRKQLRHQTLHQSKRCNHHMNPPAANPPYLPKNSSRGRGRLRSGRRQAGNEQHRK